MKIPPSTDAIFAQPEGEEITLENAPGVEFEQFIFGNALLVERLIQQDEANGQHIVICGAGPSLADHAHEYCPDADQVWGCNSALTWLADNGHKVTHGMTVDQTPEMVEEWYTAPDVEYLLASTVHPHLTEYLQDKGRRTAHFHNFVGIKKPPVIMCMCGHDGGDHGPGCVMCDCQEYDEQVVAYEDWLYWLLYQPTVRLGAGLNTVTRAIDLARFMGAGRITVLGADCAIRFRKPRPPEAVLGSAAHLKWLREETIFHANGDDALASNSSSMTLTGVIDGRIWETKPDMIISAVWLVKMARVIPYLTLVGDTLPNALMDKDDGFLDRLPKLTDSNGRPLRYEIKLDP